MSDKSPQQQTLSVRISETLRRRLERLRARVAKQTGQPVSTSEIAKQLLESAREDRLEVVDLLAEPTEALRQIRRKGNAQHTLSRAEWTVLAYFVHQGMEAFSEVTPNRVSRASTIAVLDAFSAVYELRREGPPTHERYYLSNLPPDSYAAPGRRADRIDTPTAETVRRAVARTREWLADPTWTQVPVLIGRNLHNLLEDERLPGAEAMHRALSPYWPVLWRLAARGHYVATGQPVRESARRDAARSEQPIPPLREGELSIVVMRLDGGDLSVLISFPGSLGALYPVSGYPKLAEFRAMLSALGPDGQRQWMGAHFFGYVTATSADSEGAVSFRAPENGITMALSLPQWARLQALFRRAWENVDVETLWNDLVQDYGEL